VAAVEGGHAPVLFQPVGIGGRLDEANLHEAGRLPGFRFEARNQLARVFADAKRRLGRRTVSGHQARGVPGGARGELVTLEQDHVGAAHVSQVVGDGAADHAAADDDDSRMLGNSGMSHGFSLVLGSGRLSGRRIGYPEVLGCVQPQSPKS
jgi:hypothetical protein